MNKTALKVIDQISKQLPVQLFDAAVEKRQVTGQDVLLSNVKELDGKEIDPDGTYIMHIPVRREVDHKSRMKNCFKKRGKVGLITYLRPYVKPDKFGEVQVFIMKTIR